VVGGANKRAGMKRLPLPQWLGEMACGGGQTGRHEATAPTSVVGRDGLWGKPLSLKQSTPAHRLYRLAELAVPSYGPRTLEHRNADSRAVKYFLAVPSYGPISLKL
jgi:hypothetical protein